jgi:hypothetical protein
MMRSFGIAIFETPSCQFCAHAAPMHERLPRRQDDLFVRSFLLFMLAHKPADISSTEQRRDANASPSGVGVLRPRRP